VAIPLLDYHTAARVVVRAPSPPAPSKQELRTNSFMFTWEQPLPVWYRARDPLPAGAAEVLIAGDPGAAVPADLVTRVGVRPPDAAFVRDAVFSYRTHVSIWLAPVLTTH
jgi:hypothetical protein